MQGPFTTKRIRIEIALRAGKFDDGNDIVIIDDLPMHVEVIKPGFPAFPEANVTIWGLELSKMKALSMKGHVAFQSYRNRVKIYAGEGDPEKLPLIFVGEESFGSMQCDSSGEARFELKAFSGIYAAQAPSVPVSVEGSVPAADSIRQFAIEAGYFQGDVITKMRTVANAIGADIILDDETIILLPNNAYRQSPYVTINALSGMLGYPSINSQGIQVMFLFNPSVKLRQMIHVESVIPMATGDHNVIKLTHTLDANVNSGGAWQTTIESLFNYGI